MIFLVILYLLLSNFGMVLIKLGGENNGFNLAERVINFKIDLYTILGMFFYITSFILWIIILKNFKLSYISPLVSGIAYILIIMLSLLILDEKISTYQWAGICVIFIGVVLMNIK